MIEIGGFELQSSSIALGAITGLTYGLLAVGLVIAYRSSGVINFAHAQIGYFGASLMAACVINYQLPYVVAFAFAIAAAAALSAGTESLVVRRLKKAPALITTIATIGVGQILLPLGHLVYKQNQAGGAYPVPPWFPEFHIGSLRVDQAQTAMLVLSPLLVAGLAFFFRRTRYGLAILGTAANPEAARTSGIFTTRLASLAWALGGGLSAYTAILVLPSAPFVSASFGATLLLRALAAAVVARMSSLPVALAAGVGIGIVESTVLWNYPRGGPTELLLFGVILTVLLFRPVRRGRAEEAQHRGAFREVEAWERLPEQVRKLKAVRALGPGLGTLALAAALVVPVFASNRTSFILVVIVSFALVGLSVGIVAGLAGELTFGQFALAGVGAAAAFHVNDRTSNYFLGLAGAAVVAALVAVVVALPALRIKGIMLAVCTLGFATSANSWLFMQGWVFSNDGATPGRPVVGGFAFDTDRRYYYLCLGVFLIGFWLTRNFWGGALKRRLVAVRDNDQGAAAFSVRVTLAKLQAFAFAGALAGVGGALYAHSLARVSTTTFPAAAGIDLAAMAAVGGISVLAGPLVGVFYIIGLPNFFALGAGALAASAAGWLLLLLYAPGGLAQVASPLRRRVIAFVTRGHDLEPEVASGGSSDLPVVRLGAVRDRPMPEPSAGDAGHARPGEVILRVSNISKRYAGIHAVENVSFEVRAGETLGIIGANGAGKTTLFELVSGFNKADGGSVEFLGHDVTRQSADARARLGLIRSFQDAALFSTLTVLETVELAHERLAPTRFVPAILGATRRDKAKAARALELCDLMGVASFRNKQISELSTGTRRIVDLTCLLALEPKLLLLDEPSSGIAQRETEALRDVLVRVKEQLGTTYLLIEHDMPLVMSTSNRVIAMEAGAIIAEGTPDEVKTNARVIESYLGGDTRTIERSTIPRGTRPAPAPAANGHEEAGSCTATTASGGRCQRRASDGDLCTQHARSLMRTTR